MAVSNELVRPDTEDDFEAMCHQLYGRMWRDSTCVRVGRGGQAQFGVDAVGQALDVPARVSSRGQVEASAVLPPFCFFRSLVWPLRPLRAHSVPPEPRGWGEL